MKQKKKILWMLSILLLLSGCETKSSSVLKTGEEDRIPMEDGQKESEKQEIQITVSEQPDQTEDSDTEWLYVDVCGAVQKPGVYRIRAGSRVFQVLEQAGGCTGEAALEDVNQADLLADGQKIRIYTKDEVAQMGGEVPAENGGSGEASDGRVDINRAGKEELMTLTGIGETRAQAILAYRETHGRFSSVEDLMQVEGIKEKTYEKLKEQIRIN